MIDLLKDDNVRQSIIENQRYKASYDDFEETIELNLSEHEYGYDGITYEIRTHN